MNPMWTMNVVFTEFMRAYVAERPASEVSEYVQDWVGKDQAEQRTLRLQAMVNEGLASGPSTADGRADHDELMAIARGDMA
jgi:Arc/MetJ-type ribon-helix-helix transcriptional regulator